MSGRVSAIGFTVAVAVGAAAPAQRLGAQEARIAGSWIVEYPARVMNRDGVESVEMGRARMTLEQRGDSVTGRWQSLDPGAPAGSERALRGTARGTHASLAMNAQVVINTNGEEKSVPLTITLDLAFEGDTVSGTQAAASPAWPTTSPPRAVKGMREKSPAGSGT
jgi:hypothetical protein